MKLRFVILAALCSSPVAAETLPVSWGVPADAEEVSTLRGLALDRFSGSEGRALQAVLERRIARIADGRGAPYYDIYALSSPASAGNVQAVIEGGANVSVDYGEERQKRWYCKAAKGYRTDCDKKEKEEREVICLTRSVSLSSDIRIAHEGDGRIIYRRSIPASEQITSCPEDSDFPPVSETVEKLVEGAASQYAAALSPRWGRNDYRVRESRKGLSKPQGEVFKAALKATKTDVEEACRLFDQLALETPDQSSVAFNVAMCKEMRGDLPAALAAYEALGRSADGAANRVAATMAALAVEDARR